MNAMEAHIGAAAGSHYLREDMVLILLGDDPIAWTSAEGGSVLKGMRRRYEPLLLERIRSDMNLPFLMDHITSVGKRSEVVLEHLDQNGNPMGVGLVYEGRITCVTPASANANKAAIATDTAILQPTNVRLLGTE